MTYDFDHVINRRNNAGIKWKMYDPDVLPMWVADMDFASPPAIVEALQQTVATADFGYVKPSNELIEVICNRLQRLYNWTVTAEQIVFIPSLVTGIHAACRVVGEPGDGVLMQTPVYPPFVSAPPYHEKIAQYAQLAVKQTGKTSAMRWTSTHLRRPSPTAHDCFCCVTHTIRRVLPIAVPIRSAWPRSVRAIIL